MNFTKKPIIGTIAISFLGSLPPGVTNFRVSTYLFDKRLQEAAAFTAGVALSEMVLVTTLIIIKDRLKLSTRRSNLLRILGVALFVLVTGFSAAEARSQTLSIIQPSLITLPGLLGFLMNLFNPFQLPFWVGWIFISIPDDPTKQTKTLRAIFQGSMAGFGTVLALALHAYVGHFLVNRSLFNKQMLTTFSGCSIAVAIILQLYKLCSRNRRSINN